MTLTDKIEGLIDSLTKMIAQTEQTDSKSRRDLESYAYGAQKACLKHLKSMLVLASSLETMSERKHDGNAEGYFGTEAFEAIEQADKIWSEG